MRFSNQGQARPVAGKLLRENSRSRDSPIEGESPAVAVLTLSVTWRCDRLLMVSPMRREFLPPNRSVICQRGHFCSAWSCNGNRRER